jgi:dipeptidyl aminopeptidase/acylaminoacyl peptidase
VEARIAPDGRSVLYTVIDLAGPSSTVHRWDRATRSAARIAAGGTPRWSPAGDRSVYVSSAEGGRQIWLAEGGATRRLTDHPGGVIEYAWAPDGGRLAFAAVPEAPDAGDVAADGRGAAAGEGEASDGVELYVLDVATGDAGRVTDVPGSVHVDAFGAGGSFAWSPDGTRIAFGVQPARSVEATYRADLRILDVASGEVVAAVERPGLDIRPAWSPDGSRLAFTTSYGRLDRFDTHGLAVVDLADGTVRDVGRAVDAAFLDAPAGHVWADAGSLYVLAARGLGTVLLRIDASTGETTTVLDPTRSEVAGTIAGASFAADRRTAAVLVTSPGSPWSAWTVDLGVGLPSAVEVARPRLVGATPDWEVVRWRSRDGVELEGMLFHPCPEPAGPAPLVTWLHGGPEGRAILGFDPTSPLASPAFDPLPTYGLLARGYAVFMPNFRLSAGYPAGVRKRATGNVPAALEADVLAGIDALVSRGVADPDRLALAGWASGALYALQLLTRTDRFDAAVVGATNTDLEAAYGDGDFEVQWRSLMGGAPWEARAAWDAASPLRNAERIRTPLLLLHGEADTLVPVEQSVYLETYLHGLGREVELATFPGVGHGVLLAGQRLPMAERVYDWFGRWVG